MSDNNSTGPSNGIRVAWLVAGQEILGIAQAVRGLASAVRPLGLDPVIISLSDGPFPQSMRKEGFAVDVLNMDLPPTLRGGFLNKIVLQLRVRSTSAMIRPRLAGALRAHGAQAIHVLWPNLMPLAATAANDVGIPCFWEMPNVMGKYPFGINRRLTQRTLRRWNVTALANSRYTANTLGNHPVAPIVLYLGVDERRFFPNRKDFVTREQLAIPSNAIVLGIFGRIKPTKGHALLLQAMAQLPSEYANAHLMLLGGPTDGDFADQLRKLAARLGVSERLHMIGIVADPERYYGVLDIAVNARIDAEPFGLSVVEAMMMGKPVLAHSLGGPAETVVDGATGWHVHTPTVAAFEAGLLRALGDRKRWAEMGAAGRERAMEHFSLSRQVNQYVEVIRSGLMRRST